MASDVREQLRLRLEGLEAAGIDWLPKTSGPPEGFEFAAASPELVPVEEPRREANSQEGRQITLNVLRERVSRCERCPELAVSRTQTVFGVGPIGAEILFIGEAPGADEDRQGEPFVGAAGQMLNRIITGCGLRREEIYICNILRCRPPGNRPPQPTEEQNCREYLDETIDLVGPKIIVCWGATAAQNLLRSTVGITKMRGSMYSYRDLPVICTFHPASLLEGRSPQNKKYVWEDMQMMLKSLGKPIPVKNA
ncbi:MAG: uracil-DNA glycosylase [Gemmataceae bacterium]|nr:uracil-DNA glycosylase [Gemmataceae bacterium]